MNKYYSTLVVLASCLLLSFLYCPPVNVFYDDNEIFKYFGLLIHKGGVPYRDAFDHKPPLIFFLNYVGLILGSWGLWLLDTLLVLLTSLFFLDLCKKFRLSYPWILPLLFNLLIRNFLVCEGIGMTREYTAIFLLLFFCVMLGKFRYKHLLLGLLTSLTFFMQQDQVLTLVPFLIYVLAGDDPVPLIKRILNMGAGFLVIALPIILYFAANHALSYFWEDAFLFNFTWYAKKKSLLLHFRAIKDGLVGCNYAITFIIAVILGISTLFLQNKKKRLVLAALLGVLLSFYPEYLSGKLPAPDFYYYFLPLTAAIPILAFTVFAFTEDGFLRDKKSQLLYGILLSVNVAYTDLQHATHLSRHNTDNITTRPEVRYLRQEHLKDYQLFIFDPAPLVYVYNEFGILSPSKWVYHHFWRWFDRWDADHLILQSIEQEILQHRTTYILDYSGNSDNYLDGDNIHRWNPATYALWQSFLKEYYTPVYLEDPAASHNIQDAPGANPGSPGITLWKIK